MTSIQTRKLISSAAEAQLQHAAEKFLLLCRCTDCRCTEKSYCMPLFLGCQQQQQAESRNGCRR